MAAGRPPDPRRWHRAVRAASLTPGRGTAAFVHDRRVAVFRGESGYHAIDDACPHQGASLGEGVLHDGLVICPWHSWAFDVRSGRCPRAPHVAVASYAARRTGDWIEVELPDESDERSRSDQ